MLEYKLIQCVNNRDMFMKHVNEHLSNGWKLHGSTTVTSMGQPYGSKDKLCYCQAMVKDIQSTSVANGLEPPTCMYPDLY